MWTTLHEDMDLIAAREVSVDDQDMVALVRVTDWEADAEESKILALAMLIGGTPLQAEMATVAHQDRLWGAFSIYFEQGQGAMCPIGEKFFPEDHWDEAVEWAKLQIDKPEFPLVAYLKAMVNRIGTTGWEALEGNLTAGIDRTGDPFQKGKPIGIESGEDAFGPSAPAVVREATVTSYTIKHSELDSTCWQVLFRGLLACEECDLVHTEDCGGPPESKITHRRFPERFPLPSEDSDPLAVFDDLSTIDDD